MKETLVQCDTQNPRFHAFLKINQTKAECGRQTLQDLMIRPVQRLPSISLLISGEFCTDITRPTRCALKFRISLLPFFFRYFKTYPEKQSRLCGTRTGIESDQRGDDSHQRGQTQNRRTIGTLWYLQWHRQLSGKLTCRSIIWIQKLIDVLCHVEIAGSSVVPSKFRLEMRGDRIVKQFEWPRWSDHVVFVYWLYGIVQNQEISI